MISNHLRLTVAVLTLAFAALTTNPAMAQRIQNPENGHYYELVTYTVRSEPEGWTWQEASNDAQARFLNGRQGHLATITSQQEFDWINSNINPPLNTWIGGMQDPAGSEPAGDWEWVTGEAWSFTAWGGAEPNDSGGEDCLHLRADKFWNDINCTNRYTAYILEFGSDDDDPRATFEVRKRFDDGNPGEVRVTIECTTGDPISQEATFSEADNPIEFIVQDFDRGELDCEVSEDPLEGYSTDYNAGAGQSLDTACRYLTVGHGETFTCFIENTIDQVTVLVEKAWVDEQALVNSEFLFAQGAWSCDPVATRMGDARGDSDPSEGVLKFVNPSQVAPGVFSDTDEFSFYPHYDGSTCSVTELERNSDIVSDDSDCQDFEIGPGYQVELDEDDQPIPTCTILNTHIFAGIPTLSEYGLALLALLMLGAGIVGFRRFA